MSNNESNVVATTTATPSDLGVDSEIILLMTILSCFSVVGTVGNGMVIFVFQRVRDKSTAQLFIVFMAVIDLITCVFIIPMTGYMEYINYRLESDFLCKLYHFFLTSKVPLSALLMVVIALDRYLCICHPLKRVITRGRAKVILLVLCLLVSCLGFMSAALHSVNQEFSQIDFMTIDRKAGTNISALLRGDWQGYSMRYRGFFIVQTLLQNNYSFLHNSCDWLDVTFTLNNELDVNDTRINVSLGDLETKVKCYLEQLPQYKSIVNVQFCDVSFIFFNRDVFTVYQRIYNTLFPSCLFAVFILYSLIYHFMCARRARKLRQKLIMYSYINGDGTFENTRLMSSPPGADTENTVGDSGSKRRQNSRYSYAKTSTTNFNNNRYSLGKAKSVSTSNLTQQPKDTGSVDGRIDTNDNRDKLIPEPGVTRSVSLTNNLNAFLHGEENAQKQNASASSSLLLDRNEELQGYGNNQMVDYLHVNNLGFGPGSTTISTVIPSDMEHSHVSTCYSPVHRESAGDDSDVQRCNESIKGRRTTVDREDARYSPDSTVHGDESDIHVVAQKIFSGCGHCKESSSFEENSDDCGNKQQRASNTADGHVRQPGRYNQKHQTRHRTRDSVKRYKRKKDIKRQQKISDEERRRHQDIERRRSPVSLEAERLGRENRRANVRTALMLFTVTVMFIVAYTPGWMMSLRIVPYVKLVFFFYFSYNAANPFIYAFMNHVFKTFMRKMLTCNKLEQSHH